MQEWLESETMYTTKTQSCYRRNAPIDLVLVKLPDMTETWRGWQQLIVIWILIVIWVSKDDSQTTIHCTACLFLQLRIDTISKAVRICIKKILVIGPLSGRKQAWTSRSDYNNHQIKTTIVQSVAFAKQSHFSASSTISTALFMMSTCTV